MLHLNFALNHFSCVFLRPSLCSWTHHRFLNSLLLSSERIFTTFVFVSPDHLVLLLMSLILHKLTSFRPVLGCVNGPRISPNEVPRLVLPPGDSLSPPRTPLEPQTQTQEEWSKKDEQEGEQRSSVPFFNRHDVGVRRSSEPLPQTHTEPPRETRTHLQATSELRSKSLSDCFFFSSCIFRFSFSF